MEIQIRQITLDDAKEIHRLTVELGYKIPLLETAANVEAVISHPDNCGRVAIHAGNIVGWVHAFKALRIETRPFVEIGGLVVDEALRGRGIGKKMIESVKQWCVECKIPILRLRTNTKRKEAHQFYRSLGFTEIKEQKVFELKVFS